MAKQAEPAPGLPLALPNPEELCTRPLFAFLRRHSEIYEFFFFSVTLASGADRTRRIAAEALAKAGSEVDRQRYEDVKQDTQPAMDKLKKFARLQSENMCIRTVDNFLCYVSEMVQVCLQRRPELLRSSETIKIEDILRYTRFPDLLSFLVDRKVNSLAYGGIRELEAFLADRTGVRLVENDDQRGSLVVAVELRNIYSHNRGLVSDVTLKRLAAIEHGLSLRKGQAKHTDFDELSSMGNNLMAIARNLDLQLSSKFGLRRRRFRTHKGSK